MSSLKSNERRSADLLSDYHTKLSPDPCTHEGNLRKYRTYVFLCHASIGNVLSVYILQLSFNTAEE